MNKIVILLLLSVSLCSFAQNKAKKELKSIETFEQAEDYANNSTKSKKIRLLVFNTEKHQSSLAKELLEMPSGFTKTERTQFKKIYYKVIKKEKEPHYRISYIFFDGNKMPVDEIYRLRKQIMIKYSKGVDFGDLAKKYSMATNAIQGGDSGWVKDGELPIEIEDEANNLKHQLDDIFDVGITDDNGFYIIKKTHRLKTIKEVYVLKVQEARD
ncbi:peptidylprolyl isomerase [Lacinutrix jangbogonensis]|uniref:peptidylprolyl isomerase n=1 Tax=Lacinutrix jangbogonensis TaxID=1469557 RepID=UPI00053D43BC|nr:peptidylprolyl isomerase [Lacinutrix jangbogonensis]